MKPAPEEVERVLREVARESGVDARWLGRRTAEAMRP
jgi:hypothetical protein